MMMLREGRRLLFSTLVGVFVFGMKKSRCGAGIECTLKLLLMELV